VSEVVPPEDLSSAARLIKEHSGKVLAFTGAGVSAEAGIPTFRGKDGLWNRYRPEELATPRAFESNPKRVWEWYKWRMSIIARAEPTWAHKVMADWERKGVLMGVVTQNVDGLHQRAGSRLVIELHGSIWRTRCTVCGRRFDLGFGNIPEEDLPRCRECGGLLRPDVVWFEEPVPMDQFERAERLFSEAEVILIVGTSGVVMPAALLPINAARQGKILVEVNPEETNLSSLATIRLRGPAGEIFRELARLVEEDLSWR